MHTQQAVPKVGDFGFAALMSGILFSDVMMRSIMFMLNLWYKEGRQQITCPWYKMWRRTRVQRRWHSTGTVFFNVCV